MFRNYILQNFPFLEDDFDALTDYELFCKMVEYAKRLVISNDKFVSEIESNLEKMYNEGKFDSFIEEIINLQTTFTFDSVADMKSATNLIDGSYARTSGFYSYNDGGGAYYKIRIATSEDVIDNITLFSMNNDNTLIAELIIQNEMNIKQFGALEGASHNNSNIFNVIFNLDKINRIIIPDGDYYLNEIVEINNDNIEVINYGYIHALSSITSEKPIFYIYSSENLSFKNLNITSTLDQTEPAPSGHTRINYNGSNRIAILINNSHNIKIDDLNCTNMYGDIWIWNNVNTDYNSNININNWKSINSTNPLYASRIEYLYVNNSNIKIKNELGYGNHFCYFQKWVHDVYINNSNFIVNDNYMGAGMTFVNSFQDEATSIYNIFIDNISMTSPNLFVLGTTGDCNFKISNSYFTQKMRNDNKSQNALICYSNTHADFTNCTFYDMNDIFLGVSITNTENLKIFFKDCNFHNFNSNVTNNQIINLGNCKNNIINLTNCVINCGILLYTGSLGTNNNIVINNCLVNTSNDSYAISVRNNSDKCLVLNSIFTSLITCLNIIYNGGSFGASGISFLNSFFNDYGRVASQTESDAIVKINSYLDNNIIK